jgi:anti-anti-sigma factor
MDTASQTKEPGPPLAFPIPFSGPLTIYECVELKALLTEILAAPVPQKVDLGQISHCDAAGVQLLVAASKTTRRLGKPPCFENPSEAVSRAILQAGLTPERIFEFTKETTDEGDHR